MQNSNNAYLGVQCSLRKTFSPAVITATSILEWQPLSLPLQQGLDAAAPAGIVVDAHLFATEEYSRARLVAAAISAYLTQPSNAEMVGNEGADTPEDADLWLVMYLL